MFCRICHYDLRGQETPRCPECGCSFAPGDTSTFLAELPNLRSRISDFRRWCVHRRVVILIFAAGAWLAGSMLMLPSWPAIPMPSGWSGNLKPIMTEWMIQQNDPSPRGTFDKVAARQDMQPRISQWTEQSTAANRWRSRLLFSALPTVCIPAVCYAGLISFLWTGRVRRIATFLIALFLVASIPSWCADEASKFLFRGSYNFLDDYVYLDGIDFRASIEERGRTIAAYDWRSFMYEGPKIVCFADTHLGWLEEEEARALFAAQGIPYPEAKDRKR